MLASLTQNLSTPLPAALPDEPVGTPAGSQNEPAQPVAGGWHLPRLLPAPWRGLQAPAS